MSARRGYKMTELGEVPEEWELVYFRQIVYSYRNGIYKPSRFYGRGIPSIRMYNIKGGKVNKAKAPLLDVTKPESIDYGLKPGDILINRVNSIDQVGKAGIVQEDLGAATFESKNIRVRVRPERCSPPYLAYFLCTSLFLKQIRSIIKPAASQATINQDDLDWIQICMPPLSEQQEIASVLSNVDESIQKNDQIITKTQQLKKGVVQQLFTQGIGHTTFTQTEIGKLPEDWKVCAIEEIAQVKGRIGWRGYKRTDLVDSLDGAVALGVNNISPDNRLTLDDIKRISLEKYQESPEIQAKVGDLIIATRGSLGRVALIDKDLGKTTISPNVVLLKNVRIDSSYLYYALLSPSVRQQIRFTSSATTIPLLTQDQIKSLKTPLPEPLERQKITSILLTMDERIETAMQRNEELHRLKKGLANDLLTGKVRVAVT